MNKPCCVGDADVCPSSSSCSMILRSACSHKRTRKTPTVSEVKSTGHTRRQRQFVPVLNAKGNEVDSSCNGTLQLGSLLEASLKELALKSAQKTYSILKENLYSSLELSENRDYKVYEANLDSSCTKKLHFSDISVSSNSYLNENSLSREECSGYSSGFDSDLNKSSSDSFISKMSRTQKYNRSSVNSVRAMSGSDTEEESSKIDSRLLRRRGQSSIGSNYNYSAGRNILLETEANSHSVSTERNFRNNIYSSLNNHSSISSHGNSETEAFSSDSLQHISTVQSSAFDRFRWFLWSCMYLKIIRNVNFDVWFLSRLHNYGKHKAIIIFLLPLLLYLLWGFMQSDSHSSSIGLFDKLISSLSSIGVYLSTMFSAIGSFFVHKEEVAVVTYDSEEAYCSPISSGISTISSIISGMTGLFAKTEEPSSSFVSHTVRNEESSFSSESYQPNKEEIKILIMEVLSKEINDLQRTLQDSSKQPTVQIDKSDKDKQSQSEIRSLKLQFQTLSGMVKELEKEVIHSTEKSSSKQDISVLMAEHNNRFDLLSTKLKSIEKKLEILEGLKKCCDQKWDPSDFEASLETHLTAALKNIIDSDSRAGSPYHFFNAWLTSKFIDHKKLTEEIDTVLKKYKSGERKSEINQRETINVVEDIVQNYVESLKTNLSQMKSAVYISKDAMSEEFVKKVVKEAILLYDADKTGSVDYALESGGGSVLGTRCSETFVEKNGKFSIFGLPFWSNNNSPRTAIQPGVQPGECWAFQGSQGFLVLELSATIYPTGFTLEHIPVSISPSGSIDSAPKDFSVWGLESENDNEGKLLGSYTYRTNGDPLQYFPVQTVSEEPFSIMELKIHSNHGNLEYTCLYRFRVHGKRVR